MIAKTSSMSLKNFHLAQFIIELSFLDANANQYSSSMVGCAAYYLVCKVRKVDDPWSIKLIDMTGYSERDLQSCAKVLLNVYENATSTKNNDVIRKKFSSCDFSEVTNLKLERKKTVN
jgi:hypothetical protein